MKKENGGKRAVITGLYENRGSDALCRKIYKGMISLELWRDLVMVTFCDEILFFTLGILFTKMNCILVVF
jgi:hypothetical protein